MKKLMFLVLFLPLLTFAQEKITLLVESNINYAPIGVKLMTQKDNSVGLYLTAKISEDFFSRNVYNVGKIMDYNEGELFDFDEFVLAGGFVFNIVDKIDFYTGGGIMTGPIYIPNSQRTSEWLRTTQNITLPLISFGAIFSFNRFKFSVGNETAFASEKYNMGTQLNQKSFSRLSSFTFGIGYTFNL